MAYRTIITPSGPEPLADHVSPLYVSQYYVCTLGQICNWGTYNAVVNVCKTTSWDSLKDDAEGGGTGRSAVVGSDDFAKSCYDAAAIAYPAVVTSLILSFLILIPRCGCGRWEWVEDHCKCGHLVLSLLPIISDSIAIGAFADKCISSVESAMGFISINVTEPSAVLGPPSPDGILTEERRIHSGKLGVAIALAVPFCTLLKKRAAPSSELRKQSHPPALLLNS